MIRNSFTKIGRVLGLVTAASTTAAAARDWPPLPSQGFVTGRAAGKDDVAKGNALFAAAVNGVIIGKPLPIPIPQYALLRGTNKPVILVQAEEANGLKLYGVRGLDGQETVAKDTDVELLGTQRPHN